MTAMYIAAACSRQLTIIVLFLGLSDTAYISGIGYCARHAPAAVQVHIYAQCTTVTSLMLCLQAQ